MSNRHSFAPGTVVGYRYVSPARRRFNCAVKKAMFGLLLLIAVPALLGAAIGFAQAVCAIARGLL